MELRQLASQTHVCGSRATLKAVQNGQALAVFLAADAEKRVVQPLRDACAEYHVPVTEIPTMSELGLAAKLQVPTAAAAILK